MKNSGELSLHIYFLFPEIGKRFRFRLRRGKRDIMICVDIDELAPCLILNQTGEIVETEVVRIKRKSFLSKYNKSTGWFTKWSDELDNNEVYALVVKGTVDIRGLVSLRYEKEAEITYISWMCANPDSIGYEGKEKKYNGVGGHLFAIAIARSEEFGCDGSVYGFAANEYLYDHYAKQYGAVKIGILHTYHMAIYGNAAKLIKEEYTYDWTNEEL